MEGPRSKRRKVVNKKNDLLTKLQKKIKKQTKKKIKRKEKKGDGLKEIRQCNINGVPELGRLRIKGAPGHEGMFLKGLRTQYISRKKLNEANEARKNEDINKIIDIGRVWQGEEQPNEGWKRASNVNSGPDNRKCQKMVEQDVTVTPMDFSKCPLSAISPPRTTERLGANVDATVILQGTNFAQPERDHGTKVKGKRLNFDKELIMFSLLYEEKVGSQLLPLLVDDDVLEEALRTLRNRSEEKKSEKDEALQNEFLKEFKFLRENSQPEMPLAEIFGEDFHQRNHARGAGNQSPDIFMGFGEKLVEEDLFNLSGVGACENEPVPLLAEEQCTRAESNKEFEKSNRDILTDTPQISFYRRNMF